MPNHTLFRRLLPLNIAAFLQGFVLWYAVEKLFMHHIGFNDAGIGVMVAAYCSFMILTETPSGILADRWSRKGVLAIASAALAVSGVVCGLSNEPTMFIAGIIFWGLFWACYSGTYESIIYDTVLEETGNSDQFERQLGRTKMVESLALAASSLLGGLVGDYVGLRETFFWSVPIALASIGVLLWFREPQLHKAEPLGRIGEQVAQTFKAVLSRRTVIHTMFTLLTLTLASELLFEFSQLWLIALAAPVAFYGPAFSVLMGTTAIGGFLAGFIGRHRRKVMLGTLIIMLGCALVLTWSHNLFIIVTAQLIVGIGVVIANLLLTRDLHDNLPSSVRAGAASAVSMLTRVCMVPAGLLFGYLSATYDIFLAAWMMVILVAVTLFIELPRRLQKSN